MIEEKYFGRGLLRKNGGTLNSKYNHIIIDLKNKKIINLNQKNEAYFEIRQFDDGNVLHIIYKAKANKRIITRSDGGKKK